MDFKRQLRTIYLTINVDESLRLYGIDGSPWIQMGPDRLGLLWEAMSWAEMR